MIAHKQHLRKRHTSVATAATAATHVGSRTRREKGRPVAVGLAGVRRRKSAKVEYMYKCVYGGGGDVFWRLYRECFDGDAVPVEMHTHARKLCVTARKINEYNFGDDDAHIIHILWYILHAEYSGKHMRDV